MANYVQLTPELVDHVGHFESLDDQIRQMQSASGRGLNAKTLRLWKREFLETARAYGNALLQWAGRGPLRLPESVTTLRAFAVERQLQANRLWSEYGPATGLMNRLTDAEFAALAFPDVDATADDADDPSRAIELPTWRAWLRIGAAAPGRAPIREWSYPQLYEALSGMSTALRERFFRVWFGALTVREAAGTLGAHAWSEFVAALIDAHNGLGTACFVNLLLGVFSRGVARNAGVPPATAVSHPRAALQLKALADAVKAYWFSMVRGPANSPWEEYNAARARLTAASIYDVMRNSLYHVNDGKYVSHLAAAYTELHYPTMYAYAQVHLWGLNPAHLDEWDLCAWIMDALAQDPLHALAQPGPFATRPFLGFLEVLPSPRGVFESIRQHRHMIQHPSIFHSPGPAALWTAALGNLIVSHLYRTPQPRSPQVDRIQGVLDLLGGDASSALSDAVDTHFDFLRMLPPDVVAGLLSDARVRLALADPKTSTMTSRFLTALVDEAPAGPVRSGVLPPVPTIQTILWALRHPHTNQVLFDPQHHRGVRVYINTCIADFGRGPDRPDTRLLFCLRSLANTGAAATFPMSLLQKQVNALRDSVQTSILLLYTLIVYKSPPLTQGQRQELLAAARDRPILPSILERMEETVLETECVWLPRAT